MTPEMLVAGRAAFLRLRETLDDLTHFYDCDLDEFLAGVYLAMHAETITGRSSALYGRERRRSTR